MNPLRRVLRSGSSGTMVGSIGWSWTYLGISRCSTLVAVPIILSEVGADLYAAWVLAGTLVMAQGLVDLGVGAALVRFAAIAATAGSRRVASVVLSRALAFYGALSVAVALPLILLSSELVDLVPYLAGDDARSAATLLEYAAVAFGLTNLVLVLDGFLRGLDRVSASYRVQAFGWALFVPALVIGFRFDQGIEAAGIAWLVTYGVQGIGLAVESALAMRRLPRGAASPPTIRAMLVLGGQWQVSSWADFATFQLPRLLGGIFLSSASLVSLDLALRFAQFFVAPLLAVYPVVLPAAVSVWAKEGNEGLAHLLRRWYWPGVIGLVLLTAAAAPFAAPAISVWTGRGFDGLELAVAAAILLGVAAHASTGLFTSALLATGTLAPVVRYKAVQLVLGVALVVLGSQVSVLALALGLSVAFAGPAIAFNRSARRRLDVADSKGGYGIRLAGSGLLLFCIALALVLLGRSTRPEWFELTSGAVVLSALVVLAAHFCGLGVRGRTRQAG